MNKNDYVVFIKDLKVLCETHGIGVQGTCFSESVSGEIFMFPLDREPEMEHTVYSYDDPKEGWCEIYQKDLGEEDGQGA